MQAALKTLYEPAEIYYLKYIFLKYKCQYIMAVFLHYSNKI